MIVKNESKIITRLFDTVLPIIDYWVIADTGSTDNTIDIIEEYFKEKNIPGKIVNHQWKDFGHNRTLSLIDAKNSGFNFDYLLFLDADMKLVIGPKFTKKMLMHDVYTLHQGSNTIGYYNVRLIKKSLEFKCVSPTHEYYDIQTKSFSQVSMSPEILRINDIGDGGAKHDKFERDIKLLKKGIEEEPNNLRYYFYLAQSYRCINDYENAINFYEQRIKMGGWSEEIWVSYFEIGNIYSKMENYDKAVYNYLMAYNINPIRIENIYEIAKIYRLKEKYHLANHFADMAINIIKTKNINDGQILFKQPNIYKYLIDYEKSIDAYYSGELDLGLKISNDLILNKHNFQIENIHYDSVINNIKFYVKKLSHYGEKNNKTFDINNLKIDLNQLIKQNDKELKISDHKNIFNPSIVSINGCIYINLRCANYDMQNKNNRIEYKVFKDNELLYPNNENPVSTINFLCKLNSELNIDNKNCNLVDLNSDIIKYQYSVKGIEDIRLFEYKDNLYFIGNSREATSDNSPKMVLGEYNLNKQKVEKLVLLYGYEDNKCQKNWSPFIYEGKLLLLYSFDPLIILEPNLETGECKIYKKQETKYNYSMLRGGSQGFYVNEDLYFITHEVVFSDGRLYFHRFVKMSNDLEIEKVSYPFFFNNWGVEYVAGATYNKENNNILISWGSNDKNANLTTINIDDISRLF